MAAAVANYAVAAVSGGDSVDTSEDPFTSQATGSTFVICLTYNSPDDPLSVTDNKGNVYTLQRKDSSSIVARQYVCEDGVGGAGHYASAVLQSSDYPGIHFLELRGLEAASADAAVTASAADYATPYQLTSGTPSQADELLLSYISADGSSNPANTFDETSGFTLLGQVQDSTRYWLSAVAYKIISSAAPVSTSWTVDNTGGATTTSIVLTGFKAAAGGGGSETAAIAAQGVATVSASGRSTARAAVIPAAGSAAVVAAGSAVARTQATPAAGSSIVSATTPQSESAAEIWAYVLPNGKSAGQNLAEINAVLTGAVEGDIDLPGALRVLLAVAAGKTSILPGAPGTATVEFRAVDDSGTRVSAAMVGSERAAVSITP